MNQKRRNKIIIWMSVGVIWLHMLEGASAQGDPPIVQSKTIAVGIPGAGAVARVGEFLTGPFKDVPETTPGRILDPGRILIASTSNFGSQVWLLEPGAVLSIDPRTSDQPLIIPERFAVGGGQSAALNGAVQLYTANHGSFVNSILNPLALTEILASVSVPTGISIDNAFGRLAVASAVGIRDGEGWLAILDPAGRPFKGAFGPAGGVFAGVRTNRQPPLGVPGGLVGGSFGTAFLGLSPDGSGADVFATLNGDGSISQVHAAKGVSGLLFKRLGAFSGSVEAHQSWGTGGVMRTRAGLLFQPDPERLLFYCDPSNERILVYQITNDTMLFGVSRSGLPLRIIQGIALSSPIDIAPAQPSPMSNTTLPPGSDFYVANRGNGTIARLQQDGKVVAVRRIRVDGLGVIGPGWVNGIGLSQDGTWLYVTLTGPIDVGGRVLYGLLISSPVF
jgi:DNA-binding beta-propeller fold protein YncE